jgi:hypothetical protein
MTDLTQDLAKYSPGKTVQFYLDGTIGGIWYSLSNIATMMLLHRDRREDYIIFCATYCIGITIATVHLIEQGNSEERLPQDEAPYEIIHNRKN